MIGQATMKIISLCFIVTLKDQEREMSQYEEKSIAGIVKNPWQGLPS